MESTRSEDAPRAFSEAQQSTIESITSLVCNALGPVSREAGKFAEQEALVLDVLTEVGRRALERRLQAVADEFATDLLIAEEHYRHHQEGVVQYHSLCGPLMVRRATYRLAAVRNGPTVVPLELTAGLVERATPAMAYSVAQAYAMGPLREYEVTMKAAHRRPSSRSSLERMAKRIASGVKAQIVGIEDIVREAETMPGDAHAICVGLDRTTMPMAEKRWSSRYDPSPRKRRRRPRVRTRPQPIAVNYRMAYVGTVSVTDRRGESLVVRKYAATAAEGPAQVLVRMMKDVTTLRAQRELPVAVVQDGAPELWGLVSEALTRAGIQKWTSILDVYHAKQHVAVAVETIRAGKVSEWCRRLENEHKGIDAIVERIKQGAYDAIQRLGRIPRKIMNEWGYLEGHQHKMRYASYKKRGLPIGSGVTEGACKSLVMMRTKRSGQRWRPEGATAALTLRALLQSERLIGVWDVFRRGFVADISPMRS